MGVYNEKEKTTIEFTSNGWTITLSYPVVFSENAVYEIEVSSIKFGWQ